MEENSDSKSVSAIEQSEDRFQDYYEDYGFGTAGVKFGQKYKPSIAALPRQNSVFSKELDDSPHSSS
jgi:hypothetical protein